MNVYTHHVEVPGLDNQLELIELWKESWAKHGWHPVVLNPWRMLSFSRVMRLLEKVRRLPTVNAPEYEEACYVRWALVEDAGGGVMTDYDVINQGWTPDDMSRVIAGAGYPRNVLWSAEGSVPCVVYGGREAYSKVIDQFLSFVPAPGVLHVSDMTILEQNPDLYTDTWQALQYGREGWENSRLVHFSHESLKRAPGASKAEKIKRILSL